MITKFAIELSCTLLAKSTAREEELVLMLKMATIEDTFFPPLSCESSPEIGGEILIRGKNP